MMKIRIVNFPTDDSWYVPYARGNLRLAIHAGQLVKILDTAKLCWWSTTVSDYHRVTTARQALLLNSPPLNS